MTELAAFPRAGASTSGERLCGVAAGWAALGITLSGATQLRHADAPIGPSEVVLVAWMAFVVFVLLRGVPFSVGRVFLGLGAYWLTALTLLCLGALVAIDDRRMNAGQAPHDAAAFVYVATLVCLLVLGLGRDGGRRYHLRLAKLVLMFHALAAVLLLGLASVTPELGPIGFWYAGVRFIGWAVNPNQMGLTMVGMPFLGWYCLEHSSGRRKAGFLLGIGACVVAGLLTQSDALRVAWVASLAGVGGLLWWRAVVRGRSRWLFVSHIILPALVLVVGVFHGEALIEDVRHLLFSMYYEGDQGPMRFSLWFAGLEAISESPIVGFGPGSYAGFFGAFEGWEAHNSLIDWGMSTGITGIVLHVGLWVWCFWRATRSGSLALVAMMISIVVFSLFGYWLRQPDYWLILVLALILPERRAGFPALGSGRVAPVATLGPARLGGLNPRSTVRLVPTRTR